MSTRFRLFGFLVVTLGVFLPPFVMHAANGLSFSLTPTMFDMSAVPGQSWNTTLKVVNNNPYELTVYAEPVNFEPSGEYGYGTFLPVKPEETNGATLGEWIQVSKEPVVIPKETSVSIPVSVVVPLDATPGGHYAAIMVGTRPLKNEGSLEVQTSQIITSLFFLRTTGDVIEKGEVRTFRALSWFAGSSAMSFEVRFQNDGNVHLQPRGEIVIKNMWGKERGIIPINRETSFGNVLPDSMRLYEFAWKGEQSLFDIGRYEAELTLGYGQEEKKFVTRSASFWVVPLKPVIIFLVSTLAAFWFVTRSVRAYVRYMLRMSGIDPTAMQAGNSRPRYVLHEGDVRIEKTPVSLQAPIRASVRDLRDRLQGVKKFVAVLGVLWDFVRAYKRFFLSALGFLVLFAAIWLYIVSVTKTHRDYEITIDANTNPVTVSSETIIHDRADVPAPQPTASSDEQVFLLNIVNASKTAGVGGDLSDRLVAVGYRVDDLSATLEEEKKVSVIVFDPSLEKEALVLSELMGNVLLSAFTASGTPTPTITIYIGDDYIVE